MSKEGEKMKVDVMEYREKYLKKVEERIAAKKEGIANYTSQNLHEAVMTEMNRADEDTWTVDVPEDMERALKEAEERIIGTMKHNVDLGVGKSF